MDMLEEIFSVQEALNDHTFARNDIRDRDGRVLKIETIRRAAMEGDASPNGLPNIWLRNYLRALREEADELEKDLLWKWWSKDRLDMQNIRVEIVDLLHFLVSLAQCAGLSAGDFHRLYMMKNEVNRRRQDSGYSRETKDESDNRGIV
ncbi:MAG: dUTPase [Planctomycetota bacterium]|nr:dUTPase [Planctomycetota bacterium]